MNPRKRGCVSVVVRALLKFIRDRSSTFLKTVSLWQRCNLDFCACVVLKRLFVNKPKITWHSNCCNQQLQLPVVTKSEALTKFPSAWFFVSFFVCFRQESHQNTFLYHYSYYCCKPLPHNVYIHFLEWWQWWWNMTNSLIKHCICRHNSIIQGTSSMLSTKLNYRGRLISMCFQ